MILDFCKLMIQERQEGCVLGVRFRLKKSPENREEKQETLTWQQTLLLYMHDLVYLLAVLMVVFVLLLRVVVVSGSSMYSTLWDGDYLLVLNRMFCGELEQGDIIVASKNSFNDGEPIIKRVIATEGQTVDIDFEAGVVYVDGTALEGLKIQN